MTNVNPPHDSTGGPPLRSVHTVSFAQTLRELGVSLAISTYQAGYVIVLRANAKGLNTHFRRFAKPMGLAASPGRLALGTGGEIITFHNMAAVAAKLEPVGRHDACYLPRRRQITGDIDIHELAWGASQELWLVNTRFSCLCTQSREHSFLPRWRPPFVASLGPDDRCHLNGLAVVDGRPRWVTALAASNAPQGWREDKVRGGVLVDVASGDIMCRGLSMPHSPRWHGGHLWLLESGTGGLGTVDLPTGVYSEVVRMDGFPRGMALLGPYAFVGLSQVRESAIFSGLPLVERSSQRSCGVALVHLPSGREIGFVHFLDAVQEVFAVEVLPHAWPDVLEPSDELVSTSYALPDESLQQVDPPAVGSQLSPTAIKALR
ncbi:MAG: TIGR03032 family protein [Pirellulaceae bacterium]